MIPDLENIAREYLKWLELAESGRDKAEANYDWILLELLDQMARNYSGGEMGEYLSRSDLPNRDYVTERIGEEYFPTRSLGTNTSIKREKTTPSFHDIGKFRMGGEVHQWMYDHFSLRRLLKEAGFSEIQRRSAQESEIPGFSNYGLDLHLGKPRGNSSLFMESKKKGELE